MLCLIMYCANISAWTSCITALLVIHGFILVLAQELTSTLHVAESGKHYAYIGENVIFTCVVRGSNLMAWNSTEYIGTDRLEFSSREPEGTTKMAPADPTFAKLVNISESGDGIVTMVSTLNITIQSSSSIVCQNLGGGLFNYSSFDVKSNTFVTCNKEAVCPGEQVTCTCTTAHSNALAWIGGEFFEDRIEFSSANDVNVTKEDLEGSASAVLIHNSAQNGVRVMKASLTFNVSESHTSDNLTCQNNGEAVTAHVPIAIADGCTLPTKAGTTTTIVNEDTDTTSADDTGPGKDNTKSRNIISLSTVGVVLFIIVIIIIILCLWCCPPHKWIRKLCGSKESDAGGDDDKTGNGVTNEGPEGSKQPTDENNGENKKDSPDDVVVKVVTNEELQAQLTDFKKMLMSEMESQSESEAKKRESAIREVREEGQRKREEMAEELRAHQKEMDEMNKQFEELKDENQKMFERVEEVKREKQRQLKEMEEKLRTERQSEIDKLNTQIAKLRGEVKKLEETCEQLRELDQKKQKKVEKLERELESTRRKLQSLRDSMNKRNDSGTELRRRKGHDEKYKKVFEKTYKDSTQFDTYSMANFDVSSRIFEAIKKLRREQLEALKEGLSKMNSLIEKELQDMPYDDVKVAMQ